LRIPYYQVDAFTSSVFGGNPAGVCPLDEWLDDIVLQSIAAENNLSETAFFVRREPNYELRWFTPSVEVDLCGHATLASAHVIFDVLEPGADELVFMSQSGPLRVRCEGDLLALDFPSRMPAELAPDPDLTAALGAAPAALFKSRDFLALFPAEADVAALSPDMKRLAALDCLGVIASAPGEKADFVSRFFAPGAGVDEDPVTGSAHCTLIPYWAQRLGKSRLRAFQISARGGELFCEDRGERVSIAGHAVTYLEGEIRL
jgi:PhzF family phenazine biosynthesis protein